MCLKLAACLSTLLECGEREKVKAVKEKENTCERFRLFSRSLVHGSVLDTSAVTCYVDPSEQNSAHASDMTLKFRLCYFQVQVGEKKKKANKTNDNWF